jgi:hypothetical protein
MAVHNRPTIEVSLCITGKNEVKKDGPVYETIAIQGRDT